MPDLLFDIFVIFVNIAANWKTDYINTMKKMHVFTRSPGRKQVLMHMHNASDTTRKKTEPGTHRSTAQYERP